MPPLYLAVFADLAVISLLLETRVVFSRQDGTVVTVFFLVDYLFRCCIGSMRDFYHAFGLLLFWLFFELDLEMMYPVDVLLLFDFKLINSVEQLLLNSRDSRHHTTFHVLVLAVDSLNLLFVPLFYFADCAAVVFFDLADPTLIILFADLGLDFFLEGIS